MVNQYGFKVANIYLKFYQALKISKLQMGSNGNFLCNVTRYKMVHIYKCENCVLGYTLIRLGIKLL
jgi:hypothetical protein